MAAPSRAPMPPAQQVKEKKEMRYQSCDQPDTKRKKKAQGRERRMEAGDGDRILGRRSIAAAALRRERFGTSGAICILGFGNWE